MKFYAACFVWFLIAAVLGFGLWKFSHGGGVWFVAIPTLAFVVAVGKIGCKVH